MKNDVLFHNPAAWSYPAGLGENILRVLEQTWAIKLVRWEKPRTAILNVSQAQNNERPMIDGPALWMLADNGGELIWKPVGGAGSNPDRHPDVPVTGWNMQLSSDMHAWAWTIAYRLWCRVVGQPIDYNRIWREAKEIESGLRLWPTRGQAAISREEVIARGSRVEFEGDTARVFRDQGGDRPPLLIEEFRRASECEEPYLWVISGYRPHWQRQGA